MAGNGKGRLVADKRYAAKSVAKAAPARKPRARRAPPRGGIVARALRFVWRVIWGVTWRVTAVVALLLGGWIALIHAELPEASALYDGRARGSVTMLDANGQTFAWRGETYADVTADTVSPYLLNAVVATEDKRFYGHFGVSPRGIASAIRINMREGRGPLEGNGGSTITQQVAKLLCLGVTYDPTQWESEAAYEEDCRGGGMMRKIKEVPYAMAMEWKYSKAEILTIYFNRAYLGAGARGFEAAAQRYFGVSARDVTPAQAAMLAGLLKAPSRFAPTNNLQRAQDRANVIIGLMEEQGYLTTAEAAEARANPAQLSQAAATRSGGYFADWVMETIPDFLARETTEDVTIQTTLDPRIQTAAEDALALVFENKVSEGSEAQAAIVVMSADGAVRGMVGGRATADAGSFNRATQALRQTGSAFKPFVYAVALDLGYSPSDYVEDTPLTVNIPGSGPWTPSNYDGEFKGMITLTQALQESRNIPAVRVAQAVGLDAVRTVASQFGIASNMAPGPALSLGASESTLIEMTGAYAGILNGGSAVTPYGLSELRVKGDDEPLIGQVGGINERVISEQAAGELVYMMAQVINQGTGGRAKLDREAAGKTGTTNSARDAWFVGFTADYVVGVWMGYDDNRPLTRVTGGGLPAEIWHEVMVRVNEGVPARPLPMIVPAPRDPPQGTSPSELQADPAVSQPLMNPTDADFEALLQDILNERQE
jgi:penicillin-binding protein 1A